MAELVRSEEGFLYVDIVPEVRQEASNVFSLSMREIEESTDRFIVNLNRERINNLRSIIEDDIHTEEISSRIN